MSQLLIFGTGRNTGEVRVRRVTSDGTLRVTTDGDVRIATVSPADVITYRETSAGDSRVTSAGDRRVLNLGIEGPSYYKMDAVTQDGADQFAFSYKTDPWQPTAQGGENVFAWAYVTLSWSASAIVRLIPVVDGLALPEVDAATGGTLQNVSVLCLLEQQGGSLQRLSRVFPVPLVRQLMVDDVEVTRFYLRGERLEIAIESTGPLGVGEIMLEAIEVEFSPVRKAIYASVDASGAS